MRSSNRQACSTLLSLQTRAGKDATTQSSAESPGELHQGGGRTCKPRERRPQSSKVGPKEAGMTARKSGYVVQLSGGALGFLLDVTIRSCEAERYSNGSWLDKATQENTARYGTKVACIAYGTMGRSSMQTQQTLFRMAEAAGWSRCKPDQAKASFVAWQQVLQRAVIWSEIDVALSSLGRWRR